MTLTLDGIDLDIQMALSLSFRLQWASPRLNNRLLEPMDMICPNRMVKHWNMSNV